MKSIPHAPFQRDSRLGHRKRLATVSLIAGVLILGMAAMAEAAMSEKEIAGNVEKAFGVQVLRVEPMTKNSVNKFAVTVMSPAGNRNSAYQVNTIAVDPATGNLVIQWGHGPSGHYLPAPPVSERTPPLTEFDR